MMKRISWLLGSLGVVSAACAADIGTAAGFVEAMQNEPGGSHRLTADIDLTDSGFVTVPEFSGTLDGQKHVISGVGAQPLIQLLTGTVKNLVLDGMVGDVRTTMSCGGSAVSGYGIGALCVSNFCGRIESSTVKGYKLYGTSTDKNITHYFGPFAARAIGGAVIIDCVSTNNVIGGDRYAKAGGIVGNANYSSSVEGGPLISGCVNYSRIFGQTYSNGEYLGGIVGAFGGADGKTAVVSNCVNYGKVWVDANIKDITLGGVSGGIGGAQGSDATATVMVDCRNYGTVQYDKTSNGGSSCGGILGDAWENASGFTMLRCVNYGDVLLGTTASGNAAGLFQYVNSENKGSSFVVQDCANYGNVTAPNGTAVGIGGSIKWHPSYNCRHTIRNCANYGALNGCDHTKDYQLISSVLNRSSGTCDCRNYVKFLNCFMTGATPYIDPMPNAYTVTNCISSTDTGYDAQEWCAKLNAEADANGWCKWVIGATGHPELKCFQQVAQRGLMLFIR